MQAENKPSLRELMQRHRITAHHISQKAQLPYDTVWGVVSGKVSVSSQIALRVVAAFNQLLGGKHFYYLQEVDIKIVQPGEGVRV